MFIRVLLSSLLVGVSAHAMSVDFTPKLNVWDCPQGFQFPVIECESRETEFPPQHLEFQDVGDGFYISDWSGSAQGVMIGYGAISLMIYPNDQGVVHLIANISAGFDPNEKRNPGGFFEALPESFPDWYLVTGEKRANGAREALVTLEYVDLKFTP